MALFKKIEKGIKPKSKIEKIREQVFDLRKERIKLEDRLDKAKDRKKKERLILEIAGLMERGEKLEKDYSEEIGRAKQLEEEAEADKIIKKTDDFETEIKKIEKTEERGRVPEKAGPEVDEDLEKLEEEIRIEDEAERKKAEAELGKAYKEGGL